MTQRRRHRIIVDTDAKNEADDQFAIVHALLSPTLDVRGLIAAHFGTARSTTSRADSRAEIDRLLALMALTGRAPVADGGDHALPDPATPVDSPGARLIIDESRLATPEDPLYVTVLGPLTDLASALLIDPALVERPVIVIWVGGMGYDVDPSYEGVEFNLRNDVAAATVVLDSGITVWQVPASVYGMVSVGYAELDERLAGTSALADALIAEVHRFNDTHHAVPIESRSLGDSPAIGLVLNPRGAVWRSRPAPRFADDGAYVEGAGHPIRVIDSVDTRWLIEDLMAKLRRFGRTRPER